LRLVLSIWNLFEIGAASDGAQQKKRLSFLERLDPVWIVERVEVQKQEVKRFLWPHYFHRPPEDLMVFTPSLSVVVSFWSERSTPIGLTPSQFIGGTDYASLNPLKKLSPQAQATMKAAGPKVLKEKNHDIFAAWIRPLIPFRDPDRRLLTVGAQSELVEFCSGTEQSSWGSARQSRSRMRSPPSAPAIRAVVR
jgi:hypothetical protein